MSVKENIKYVDPSAAKEFKEEYADYRKEKRDNYSKIKYYPKGKFFWESLAKGIFRSSKKK